MQREKKNRANERRITHKFCVIIENTCTATNANMYHSFSEMQFYKKILTSKYVINSLHKLHLYRFKMNQETAQENYYFCYSRKIYHSFFFLQFCPLFSSAKCRMLLFSAHKFKQKVSLKVHNMIDCFMQATNTAMRCFG